MMRLMSPISGAGGDAAPRVPLGGTWTLTYGRISHAEADQMSTPPSFQVGDGLLLVDPQNDFCPGGSLPVADGDAVMPVLNAWAEAAEAAGVPIFVSRDWHPATTTHFKAYGGAWPPHCLMGPRGAELH